MLTTTHSLLSEALSGAVVLPGDRGWDEARSGFNLLLDQHPAAVAYPAHAEDVSVAVAYARAAGLRVAPQATAHNQGPLGGMADTLLLNVSRLQEVHVDPAARRVRVGAGVKWDRVAPRLSAHGLAGLHGSSPDVGIAGYSLGGGIGWLARKYGMQANAVTAFEIVTGDGDLVRADAENHPDLFWAIRGGGGNFGVATRFRFQLHDVSAFTGGMMVLPATAEIVAGFIAAAAAAPDELSTIANVMPCPPLPFVSQEHHGELVIFAILGCVGEPEAAAAAIAPLRALATPLADMVQPMPYAAIYPPEDPEYRPKAVATTLFVDHVDLDTAALIMDRLAASDATMRACQLRVLGGAMARVPADATAFAHRGSRILVNVAAFYEGPEDQEVRERWVADFHRDLEGDDTGAYVNFVANEGEARVRAAYPGSTWDRLREVKRRYDPDNVFRRNQNVPPATV
ncbi:MAG: FAD-binding oxidoreductase [Chloroflexota bacterium]